jgi:hypothetical protein
MELLINAPSDLFQVDVLYFFKAASKEFQFIKFTLSHSIEQNLTIMSCVEKDLLAVGQEYQFKLLGQSDLTSCTRYGNYLLMQRWM